MTAEELVDLLNTLERDLNEVDLSSLVDQERIAAVEGKAEQPTSEDIEAVHQDWVRRGLKRPTRPRSKDVRIRPLDISERLAHLLDLLEVSIGGSYAIETHLRNDLEAVLDEPAQEEAASSWNGEIVFITPAPAGLATNDQTEWSLPDQKTLVQREASVRRVILLIEQLRNEIGAHRSPQLERAISTNNSEFDSEFPGGWS